jgi:hypothetical protein
MELQRTFFTNDQTQCIMKSADKPAQSEKITAQSATSTPTVKTKPIAANFDGGKLTSDASAILLQQVDLKIRRNRSRIIVR